MEQILCGIIRDKDPDHEKFNLDSGADMTAFNLDLADNRHKQHHHSKGYNTASRERIPDFEGARLKFTDELDVNGSITSRYTFVLKILASASQMCNKGTQ